MTTTTSTLQSLQPAQLRQPSRSAGVHRTAALCSRTCRWFAFVGVAIAFFTAIPSGGWATTHAGEVLAPSNPTIADAQRAYTCVRSWLEAWDTAAEAKALPPAAWGACVELRFQGQLVGRGVAMASLDGAGRADVLAIATRGAMRGAARVLKLDVDALAKSRKTEVAPLFMVSIQLAHQPIPITPATPTDVDAELSPGVQGLALVCDGNINAQFPSELFAERRSASQAGPIIAASLFADAAIALAEPGVLRARHRVTYLKFDVVHVAQSRVDGPALPLYRGSGLVDGTSMNSRAKLVVFIQAMRTHLELSLQRSQTFVDKEQKLDASTAALAALSCANARQATGIRDGIGEGFLINALADATNIDKRAWEDLTTDALVTSAFVAAEKALESAPELGDGARHVVACRRIRDALGDNPETRLSAIAGPQRALIVWACAHGILDADLKKLIQPLAAKLLLDRPIAELPATLPWSGFALLDLPAGGETELRELRALIHKHQLTAEDIDASSLDTVGAIVFTRSKNPLPTWQTARATAFLARALRSPRITPIEDRSAHLARVLSALRFLRQLQVDESAGWMDAADKSQLGAIRLAPWEPRTSVEATAMTLIAACEALKSLDEISKPEVKPPVPVPAAPTAK